MGYERVQILLEPRQHKALQRIARRRQKSLSQLMREMTDKYLVEPEGDEMLQTLGELRTIRERQPIYRGDPVAEARAERERQVDEVSKDMLDNDRH